MKYVLNVTYGEKNNAGSKAKADVTEILTKKLLFKAIQFQQLESRAERVHLGYSKIKHVLENVHSGDTLVIQYPTYNGHTLESLLLKKLQAKHVKLIAFVHDIDVLRYEKKIFYKNVAWECRLLNKFDVIISPNSRMTQLLKRNGLVRPVVNLQVYDYLQEQSFPMRSTQFQAISFAGNLTKSTFLSKVKIPTDYLLHLYGNKPDANVLENKRVKYHGSFSPEELINVMPNGFGLVWDGPNPRELSGTMGKYLGYNNPHKVSLYLSAGLPILISDKAAISDFIISNHVGIIVNNLDELAFTLKQVSSSDFLVLQKNAQKLGGKLREGYYSQLAVQQALNML
ncbi:hypothetical protein RA086_04820 [Lactiplantibacillus sp. WILCCON 0030]|uniref:Beta-1,6-galactofuranosyltransferase n=1 Tax=Lactiplantibacillus brownii TaxID=3069269 RepID=A0ABU1A9C5_9LACO|nr:hypothetical protein [Lactiplantibacillus brownii]MDQ7936965.1 hypothetical protein [Lactiplantibacillus brownii]